MRTAAKIAGLLLLVVPVMGAEQTPRFEDHHVEVSMVTLRRADPSTHPKAEEITRKYRTMFADEAKAGPNFAGKYRLVQWGCGSGCVSWAIVDLNTGRIHIDEIFGTLMFIPGGNFPGNWLEFRKDSSLLVAQGVANEPGVVKRYFLDWDGSKLRMLRSELIFDGRPDRP